MTTISAKGTSRQVMLLRKRIPRIMLTTIGFYLIVRRLTAWGITSTKRAAPMWLSRLMCKLLRSYSALVGVTVGSNVRAWGEKDLDPERQYMIVWHPHGFYTWTALFLASTYAVEGSPFSGKPWFAMVAPALFKLPGLRELLILVNARLVTGKCVDRMLTAGCNIGIQPGGVSEQLRTTHDQEQAMFPPNLGFIRTAIKHGTPMIPTYLYGENQLWETTTGMQRLTHWLYQRTGLGFPNVFGKFGIPAGGLTPIGCFMPKSQTIHIRWGNVVEAGPKDANPSEARVKDLFNRYCAELSRLFNEHKDSCLPPEVAAKGLKIYHRQQSDGGRKSKL